MTEKTTLKGKTAWLISDGRAGSDAQCVGIARALGLNFTVKPVSPSGIRKFLAPWVPPSRTERMGQPGSLFPSPWPDLVMAGSRQSIPYLRAIRKASNGNTYAVVLLDPKTGPDIADIIWVPEHDKLRAKNVISSLTPPHAFSPTRLAKIRSDTPPLIADLPRPYVMLSLGGKNAIYRYTPEVIERFETSITSLATQGVSFLVTPSRRTPSALIEAAKRAVKNAPHIVWNGDAPNPYADFLAQADMMIVTADSISMTSEACATGKPVYIFEPDGGSNKFRRFHLALENHGATKPLPTKFETLDAWSYEPLYSTDEIAERIEKHWRDVFLPSTS